MRTTVTRAFVHANTGRRYDAGDEFDGTAAQAGKLAAMGFVSFGDEPAAGGELDDGRQDAADDADLDAMTVRQLVELCGEYGIDTPSKPKKEDLVAALRLYLAESDGEQEAE